MYEYNWIKVIRIINMQTNLKIINFLFPRLFSSQDLKLFIAKISMQEIVQNLLNRKGTLRKISYQELYENKFIARF